jgi:Polysaccharide biosynthesis protein
MMVLARLLEPKDFGLLGMVPAFTGVLKQMIARLGITHRRTAYDHPDGKSNIEPFHRSLKGEENNAVA